MAIRLALVFGRREPPFAVRGRLPIASLIGGGCSSSDPSFRPRARRVFKSCGAIRERCFVPVYFCGIGAIVDGAAQPLD
jgi:hypothetical protein